MTNNYYNNYSTPNKGIWSSLFENCSNIQLFFFFFLLFSLDFGYQGQLRDFSEVEPLLEISCFLSREVFLRYCIIYASLCLLFWENWITINSILLILRKCLATVPTHMFDNNSFCFSVFAAPCWSHHKWRT